MSMETEMAELQALVSQMSTDVIALKSATAELKAAVASLQAGVAPRPSTSPEATPVPEPAPTPGPVTEPAGPSEPGVANDASQSGSDTEVVTLEPGEKLTVESREAGAKARSARKAR